MDDVGEQLVSDPKSLAIFSGGAHHYNLFLIYVTQFMFLNNEIQRQALRQAQYILCFDNVKHRMGLKTLSKQIFGNADFLNAAIMDRGPYEFLLLDLRPELTKEFLRCRSGPFCDNLLVYVPIKRLQ